MSQTSAAQGTAKSIALMNRRATIRYQCAPATVGRVFSADDQEFQRAWILDLSLKGIGMQLLRPLEPGQMIAVAIKSNDGKKTFDLSAHVMHCHVNQQGECNVGCELTIPLTPDELDQLL
ncbi:MAG: PilZ domain-containing protein [Planctomycetes bacterium]|nr:PilZ domain-containing protein [Planctomycetota bacterium]